MTEKPLPWASNAGFDGKFAAGRQDSRERPK
jgi:hypothetical protein